MAGTDAISAVDATRVALLKDRISPVPSVSVRRLDVESDDEGEGINLFLYRVSEHPHLKNQELSPRTGGGPAPLALMLHYLLSVSGGGSGDESRTHTLLGNAMQVLNDDAIISRHTLSVRSSVPVMLLAEPLQNEYEALTITLEPLSLEDLTKIWTATTKPYRLSVGYMVSVIQIQRQPTPELRRVAEPPFGGPRVQVVTLRFPRISQVLVRRSEGPLSNAPFARIGDTLVLKGTSLEDDSAGVFLSGVAIAPQHILYRSGERLDVRLPDDPAFEPGMLGVEVRVSLASGTSHLAPVRSNRALMMLVPHVTAATLDAARVELTITGTRLAGDDLVVSVGPFLLERGGSPAGTFPQVAATQLRVHLPSALPVGSHLVRVRVNGAESFDAVEVGA
jgi:hypothetical protein